MLRELGHYPRFVTFGIIISYSRDQDPDFNTWIRLATCAYHIYWSRQSANDSCSMPSHFWLFMQLNWDRYLWPKFISVSARFNSSYWQSRGKDEERTLAEVQRKKHCFWKLGVNFVLQCSGRSRISQRGRQPKRWGYELIKNWPPPSPLNPPMQYYCKLKKNKFFLSVWQANCLCAWDTQDPLKLVCSGCK